MSGVGPVEPVDPPEADGRRDVIGDDAPRLTDRLTGRLTGRLTDRLSGHWPTRLTGRLTTRPARSGLPAHPACHPTRHPPGPSTRHPPDPSARRPPDPRTGATPRARRLTAATAAVAAVTATLLLVPPAATPDRAGPPAPVPWPVNVTSWRYLGLAAPLDPRTGDGLFRFAVTVSRGPAVAVRVIGTAFDGLGARAVPKPEFVVPGGSTRRITVEISVSDCSELPLIADLPFLDVTLRNKRAIQHHSFIFGGAHSRDLSDLLRGACGPAAARPPSRPTGSAHSQNADRGGISPNQSSGPLAEARHPSRHNKKVTSQRTPLPMGTSRA
ncbi:hypothetical protein GCM10010129_30090 [Streptomyces fumigatiscleroticus]|nr:hypothetical protein GCM10010129_30090 [Streptomyces fumigatiscleroticus]